MQLTPEQIAQLKKELANLGVTANSSIEDVADKIEPKIEEVLNEAQFIQSTDLVFAPTVHIDSSLLQITSRWRETEGFVPAACPERSEGSPTNFNKFLFLSTIML
jgi:hypothetical protein